MAVRLGKLTKELNVGVQRMAEFLSKKGYQIDNNPNAKLGTAEHEELIKEFVADKAMATRMLKEIHEPSVKDSTSAIASVAIDETESPQVITSIKEEEKPETSLPKEIVIEHISTKLNADQIPHFTTVGKIDLDAHKKVAKTEKVEKIEEPVITIEPVEVIKETPIQVAEVIEQKVIVEEPIQEPVKEIIHELVPEPVKETFPTPKLEPQVVIEPKEEPTPIKAEEVIIPTEEVIATLEEEPFRLSRPQITMDVKQVGYIDLSAMNHSTRPAKKTKEEKRKEREEKEAAAKPKIEKPAAKKEGEHDKKPFHKEESSADKKKKKRDRIHRESTPSSATNGNNNNNNNTKPNPNPNGNTNNTQKPFNKNDKNKPTLRRPEKTEVTEEDVQKQIKETLARLTAKPKKGVKYRKEKRDSVERNRQEQAELDSLDSKTLKVTEFVTVNDLANMMDVPVIKVIQTCMNLGYMVSINQRLDAEIINFVADEFGYTTEYVSAEVAEAIIVEEDKEEDLETRPPIVTVMGHVDHGKTSLLDYIRSANVIGGEAGGITQHIGAYHVKLKDGRMITFLDTPGHEAFTAMRARGAKVTDIVIIIVAADDSVMPQTIEAINHAAAAGVPMVFAINKIDKPGANPDKIREALANMNYLVESWGGKYQDQEISAKKGLGIEELMEKVLLESELLELRANPNKKATGSIIESTLDKGRGFVSTVLVSNGTLKNGDVVVAGTSFGRVKAMFNERNARVLSAGPAEPVLILGLNGAPTAGDTFNVMDSEQEAREICTKREQLQREQSLRTQKMLTLDDIGRRLAIGNFQQLNIIVKGDVDGSVEALSDSLIKLSTEEIQVRVIHKAVGQISDSDVMLAATSEAIIIGFQVRPSTSARRLADNEGVEIRHYSIIYDAIEEVTSAMEGMLSPEIKEEITATIEIREVFKITKVGTVAGCMVKEGKVKRSNKIRIIREGIVIHTGNLDSLKRFKDDVKEVSNGYECGLNIKNYNDIRVGDIIESYEEIEIKKSL